MRCTRCDRIAIPQSVGETRAGLVVFGWCLACMEDAGCTNIEIADAEGCEAPVLLHRSLSRRPSFHPDTIDLLNQRRRLCLALAAFLSLWSLVLMLAGLKSTFARTNDIGSPLGNGTPTLLLTSGFATALVALFLVFLSHGQSFLSQRRTWKWIQTSSFGVAILILMGGIAFHDATRDPFIVAAAGCALSLSIVAHLRERRFWPQPSQSPLSNQVPHL